MKGIIGGRVCSVPDDIKDGEYVTKWDNCIFIEEGKTRLGRIYYQDGDDWVTVATDVRSYYVGESNRKMPCYIEKAGYTIYNTDNSSEYTLLDCVTGKTIIEGIHEIDTRLFVGMSKDRKKSCILYDMIEDDWWKVALSDSQGKTILKKLYLDFLTEESFGGVWLFKSEKNCEQKFGVYTYFEGKARMIIPEKNDEVTYNGTFIDSKGKIWFPTIKARRGGKYNIFDINGRKIQQ